MHTKDIAEIRRRFRPEKSNIARIRGCYVNEANEIIATFNQSLGLMDEDEAGELLSILKKVLSGTPGKNLHDIRFSTHQVLEDEAHRLLTALRKSGLDDDEAVKTFYSKVIEAVQMEGNYMILLAADRYDMAGYGADGTKQEDSTKSFSYFVCSICPLKQTRPALGYLAEENRFCNLASDWVIAAPELGFMFPAFSHRAADIYGAYYYTRSTSQSQSAFAQSIFGSELPMPATVQKETFSAILAESVAEDCSYEIAQTVHEQISALAEVKKAARDDDEDELPLVSKKLVCSILEDCGISEGRINTFAERYDSEFGAATELPPVNLVDRGRFAVKTPDVVIQVNPEASDLVQTRIIDGEKYILIRAEAGVEVNGLPIKIRD
ncbi:MAG: DUF4317 domain-containing protein [Clostridia bacterium]|nr:DUF4317 domain-containing protein [Clostridia bacterium]